MTRAERITTLYTSTTDRIGKILSFYPKNISVTRRGWVTDHHLPSVQMTSTLACDQTPKQAGYLGLHHCKELSARQRECFQDILKAPRGNFLSRDCSHNRSRKRSSTEGHRYPQTPPMTDAVLPAWDSYSSETHQTDRMLKDWRAFLWCGGREGIHQKDKAFRLFVD